MSEPTPVYIVKVGGGTPPTLPGWAVKLIYRLLQVSDRPGEYTFRLIIHEDGLKELEVIQPPKAERLGY